MMIIDQFVIRQLSDNKKSQLKKVFLQKNHRTILIIITMDSLDVLYRECRQEQEKDYSTTTIKQFQSLIQEQKINKNNICHIRDNHFHLQHQILHSIQSLGEKYVQIPNRIIQNYCSQYFDEIDLIRDHHLPRLHLISHFLRQQQNKYQQISNKVIKYYRLLLSQIQHQQQQIKNEKGDVQNQIKINRQPDLPPPNTPLQPELPSPNTPLQPELPSPNTPLQPELPSPNNIDTIHPFQGFQINDTIYSKTQNTMKLISTKIKNIVNTYVPNAQYKRYSDALMIIKSNYPKKRCNEQKFVRKQKDINPQNHETQAKRDNISASSTDIVQLQLHQDLRKKILLGQTAVGKTSLINFFFDKNFAIGMGDCTSQIIQVKQYLQIKIYDSNPLQTSQFHDYSYQEYLQYCKYDEIYFLYCTSLKNISKFIKKIIELKKLSHKIYFIRTKCDNFDSKQLKTYKQQIQTDRNLLIDWGLNSNQISIFGVSVKDKKMSAFDNKKVYNLLKS